jgi:hypothetical protein
MTRLRPLYPGSWRRDKDACGALGGAPETPLRRGGASMHGDRGQSAEIINRVLIDVVTAIGPYGAAARRHSSTIPHDYRMRDEKNGDRVYRESGTVVAGNDITPHDDEAEPAARFDAVTGVV